MRQLADYLELARQRLKTDSDRELSRRLGLSDPAVNHMRMRNALPSDATMVKLAEICGVAADEALLELNIWRAKDGATRSIYEKIAATLKRAAAVIGWIILFGAGTAPMVGTSRAQAAVSSGPMYIMENARRRFRRAIKR